MVEYMKLKIGDELCKATVLEEQSFLQMLSSNQVDAEWVQYEIDNGKRFELAGYYLFAKPPLYGISAQIDYGNQKLYIELIENLDANYLMQERNCEAVFNCIEYAYQTIETHKLMGRFDRNVKIVEIKMERE